MIEDAGFRALLHRPGVLLREDRPCPGRPATIGRPPISIGSSWRARHALTAFLLRQDRKEEALGTARKAAADFPAEVPLQVDLVEALLTAGDPHEAATVLDGVAALPYEGASDIHGLYVRAHVGIGLEA